MILGIDFGTCFSSVAFMNGLIPVTDYIKDPNKTGIPTLFMYSRNTNRELYGYDCTTAEAIMNSADVVRYMKRTIRENPKNLNTTITSGGRNYTIREVVKKYLSYLLTQARSAAIQSGEFTNTNIEGVTVTAPVGIAQGQMTATDYNELLVTTIAEITGLPRNKINVLQEPVSAAVSYLYSEDVKRKYSQKQTILVFDLGGGTLDVTIVEHDPQTMTYNIRAKEGDLKLGGNDWDRALGNAVLGKLGMTDSFPSVEERAKFQNSLVRLKQELSYANDSTIVFKHNGSSRFADVTRSEFDRATKSLLDRAIAVTKKAISSYSTRGVAAIDKIILVGGGCNMPQIRNRMLTEFSALGANNIITHDPSKAIAKGAAVFSKMESRKSFGTTTTNRKMKVNDIASHTYGFGTRRFRDKKYMIYNVLFKGTPFDASGKIVAKSKSDFIPLENTQTSVRWVVYESDAPRGVGEDENWMDYGSNENKNGMEVVVQVPSEYHGRATEYSCWITFSLDDNGILELIVTDKTGKRVGYDKKHT